jgi:hypothetical protein
MQTNFENDNSMMDVSSAADSLDHFDTLYHDLYSLEDYKQLEVMMMVMPDVSE